MHGEIVLVVRLQECDKYEEWRDDPVRVADPVPGAGPAEGRRLHHSDRGTPPGLLSPPHSRARRETRTPQSESAP